MGSCRRIVGREQVVGGLSSIVVRLMPVSISVRPNGVVALSVCVGLNPECDGCFFAKPTTEPHQTEPHCGVIILVNLKPI